MRSTADVVIIGAGIVGASIAWHLTSRACRNVALVERESQPGKGSTGKSMGGVRAQFATALNIRMSMHSIAFFREFDRALGHPSGYRPQGYLFVATSQAHMDYLRANVEAQRAEGLSAVRLVSPAEILAMLPQLRPDDIVGGSFCSTDGFVDPHSVMTGFLLRAAAQGAELIRGAEVTAIERDARGVCAVHTSQGSIATRIVVNCAGAWARGVARMAGIDLPVEPLRRMLVPTEPFDRIAHSAPMTIDMSSGFHFRPEGLGFLMAWNDPEETAGFKTQVDRAFVEKILTRAVSRVPVFAEASVNPSRAWAGLYEMTPDHHPVLGPVAAVPGFYLANGFSGHGVMHSPATGKVLADLILDGASGLVDALVLALERFAEGRLLYEPVVL
jgi:sarcosine oxidase subunit beta